MGSFFSGACRSFVVSGILVLMVVVLAGCELDGADKASVADFPQPKGIVQTRTADDGVFEIAVVVNPSGEDVFPANLDHLRGVDLFDSQALAAAGGIRAQLVDDADAKRDADDHRLGSSRGDFRLRPDPYVIFTNHNTGPYINDRNAPDAEPLLYSSYIYGDWRTFVTQTPGTTQEVVFSNQFLTATTKAEVSAERILTLRVNEQLTYFSNGPILADSNGDINLRLVSPDANSITKWSTQAPASEHCPFLKYGRILHVQATVLVRAPERPIQDGIYAGGHLVFIIPLQCGIFSQLDADTTKYYTGRWNVTATPPIKGSYTLNPAQTYFGDTLDLHFYLHQSLTDRGKHGFNETAITVKEVEFTL
jgi:hypothetical protein